MYSRVHEILNHFLEDFLGHLAAHEAVTDGHDVVEHLLVVQGLQAVELKCGLGACKQRGRVERLLNLSQQSMPSIAMCS